MKLPKDKSRLLGELVSRDILTPLVKGSAASYYIDSVTNKIKVELREKRLDHNWIHNEAPLGGNCDVYQEIFNAFRFVPTYCLDCYKLVVRPKTVKQLIQLWELQDELGLPSKCGWESREYVHGNYGGYFYARGLEHGKQLQKELVPKIEEKLGHVPIHLKRFCTEFEHELCSGDTSRYQQPIGAKEIEAKMIDALDDCYKEEAKSQPDFLKERIMLRWLKKAYSAGDETALEFNNGQPFLPQVETY
jgi:hypothetical protein